MKTNYIFRIFIAGGILASASALTGCTDDFEKINTDPNKIVVGQVQAYNMFEPMLYDGARNRQYHTWYYAGEIVQYTASISANIRISSYTDLNNKYFETVWNFFCNQGANAQHMYDLAAEAQDKAAMAVALTMKVMNMEEVTALFGDIPYKEAFKARKNGNTTPVFDSQREVYEQMIAELDTANNYYATSPKFQRSNMDGMYGGDMYKWRRFNNSLKLRLLCRISNRDEEMGGYVSSKLKEMVAAPSKYPIFTSNDDNATVKLTGTSPYINYFYNYTFKDYTNVRVMTQEMVKQLVEIDSDGFQRTEDPRAKCMYFKNISSGNTNNEWRGAIAGASTSQMEKNPSYLSLLCAPVLISPTTPYTFMDYAEVELILAEMAYKGLIDGGESVAKTHYEAGVTASCMRWKALYDACAIWDVDFPKPEAILTKHITELLSSSIASWDQNSDKLRLLGNQKFIALFQNSYQAFPEIQRTGYPELTVGEGTGSNNYKFPTRFAYPITTVGTNPVHYREALEHQGWKENNMRESMWYSIKAAKGINKPW